MRTAPVLAVLVCHDGAEWLGEAIDAIRASTVRPHGVIAVDTGSVDRTAELLQAETDTDDSVLTAVVTAPSAASLAEAVDAALTHEAAPTGTEWLWLLHDDCAAEPDCLAGLLNAADAAPSAGVLGPLAVDWSDPRLVVEAGLSTDASGHRHADVALDHADLTEQSSDVLAVPTAGALISRAVWDEVGGLDDTFPVAGADIDLGWRVNAAGRTVLCVPRAHLRHARAGSTGQRRVVADGDRPAAATARIAGLRAYLVNCSGPAFVLGLPRLLSLCVLRAVAFAVTGRGQRASAELAAAGYLLRGAGQLSDARAARVQQRSQAGGHPGRGGVRGLFVGRFARLRRRIRAGALALVRRRVATDVAIGRLPDTATSHATWTPPEELRAAAFAGGRTADVVAVNVAEPTRAGDTRQHRPWRPAGHRPTPGVSEPAGLVFVEVDRKRLLTATLLAPPVVLTVLLTGLAVLVNIDRLGLDLAGGRLLPVGDLREVWSTYLAAWHPAGGGTSADAPAALAVLGAIGAVLWPLGGPPAVVAMIMLGSIPLAALSAYTATRRLDVSRWARALLAAGYALVPPATAAVAQGRLDVVVVHILLPLVIAGVAGVLRPEGIGRHRADSRRWLSRASVAAIGVAVVGAFSPLTHVLVLVATVVGFVVVPSAVQLGRRIAGVAIVVLLPIALLLPWPVTVVTNPELLLHGIGGRVPEIRPSSAELFALDPGGAGAWPLGVLLVVVVIVGLVLRPSWRALVGASVTLLGLAGVVVLRLLPTAPAIGGTERAGWVGAPLLVVCAGLGMVLLAVVSGGGQQSTAGTLGLPHRLAAGAGLGVVLVLAAGAAFAGDGPLRPADETALAAPMADEVASADRSVLILRTDGQPPQIGGGGVPAFGDDDLPLPEGTPQRLADWQEVLLTGGTERNAVRDTVARAAAAGVLFVVLPDGVPAEPLLRAGGEVVTTAAPTADGRQVVRLKPTAGPVSLIAPELSQRAISEQPPTGDIEGDGVAVVNAALPEVRVRASDGPGGRLLVLAATHEDGWRASVDGERQRIVRAWGHQVAVAVPTRAADVVVERDEPVRTVLLLGQVGAVLFTALTAVPARRSR